MPWDQKIKGDIKAVNVRKPTWGISGNTYGWAEGDIEEARKWERLDGVFGR
jgi:hypothetical protein